MIKSSDLTTSLIAGASPKRIVQTLRRAVGVASLSSACSISGSERCAALMVYNNCSDSPGCNNLVRANSASFCSGVPPAPAPGGTAKHSVEVAPARFPVFEGSR